MFFIKSQIQNPKSICSSISLLLLYQKGIDENWAAALEHNPEAFARVAFVDSGAQSTIISKSCAERCALLRLMDQRYKGIAHGVGQSEILGRIHVAPIKVGNVFYPCSFVVLDSPNMDFLFGLDMLRKHQCIIDLKENVLRVGGGEVSVPFLQEKDIPTNFLDEVAKQASSSGAQGPEFEAKVTRLIELGFGREAVVQALKFFDGNEDQAAGMLHDQFNKFGVVNDVFIPQKRRKLTNTIFGFVRYDCFITANIAEQKANGLWVDDKSLSVKIVEYGKGMEDRQKQKPLPTRRSEPMKASVMAPK
ncbi:hypothetical protein TEA_028378 [Camellia sinensis var. sinensis]|uniref:UBA domain-containing protein n=1 Tax=Camellia sinensis var. sinensis TaxID=542762 RepID=A0A4S4DK66_CAMSN|nr:hypothetical protein TEA_028378 [Camellia sinensis var. sinensis]